MHKCARFFAMVTVGTVVMFGVSGDACLHAAHVRPARVNRGIVVASALVFVAALWLVRSQRTVDDESWMKAMIPRHPIAILTSARAQLRDSRVRELADQIIETQRREIARMEDLLRELQNRTAAN